MAVKTVGLLIEARGGPGVLHETTGIIARHEGDITLVEILERGPRWTASTSRSSCRGRWR